MPFTFAHPAIVVPLHRIARNWFSLTALVMGSIAPDFEYYLRLRKGLSHYSHSLGGLFYFNLPFGLFLCLVFHKLVRKPMVAHLPEPLKRRFGHQGIGWHHFLRRHPVMVLYSLLIGATSHIAWDELTHFALPYQQPLATVNLPGLSFAIREYDVFHAAQSLAGIAVMGFMIYRLPKWAPEQRASVYFFWTVVLVLTIGLFIIRVKLGTALTGDDLLVSAISLFLLSLVLACAYFKYRSGRRL